MISQEQREAIRREALARIARASRVQELAVITASDGREEWTVRVQVRAEEYFYVAGRDTGFDVYITKTNAGYLVAVTNHQRCGHLPAKCTYHDVMEYLDWDNSVDAATLAAGVNYIIDAGIVPDHPVVSAE